MGLVALVKDYVALLRCPADCSGQTFGSKNDLKTHLENECKSTVLACGCAPANLQIPFLSSEMRSVFASRKLKCSLKTANRRLRRMRKSSSKFSLKDAIYNLSLKA